MRTTGRILLAAFIVVLVAPGLRLARALTLAPMTLSEMTDASELVVRARCVDRTSTRTDDGGIESVVRLDVLETAKGESPERIEVRQPGGAIDDMEMVVPGVPRIEAGDEALLFLERAPQGYLRVVGLALGYLPVASAPGRASTVRVMPHLGEGFESGGTRPVSDVLGRVRRRAETSR